MNPEKLEEHLKALGAATSPRHSLVDGVMERLSHVQSPRPMTMRRGSSLYVRAGAALLAVAASVAIVVTGMHLSGGPRHVDDPRGVPVKVVSGTASTPMLADYRRAVFKSPEALDAMLREPAASGGSLPEPAIRACDFSRVALNLN